MPSNLTPTKVKQITFNTDEVSKKADPEWSRDRNYLTAYEFNSGKRKFIDNRNRVYTHSQDEE